MAVSRKPAAQLDIASHPSAGKWKSRKSMGALLTSDHLGFPPGDPGNCAVKPRSTNEKSSVMETNGNRGTLAPTLPRWPFTS